MTAIIYRHFEILVAVGVEDNNALLLQVSYPKQLMQHIMEMHVSHVPLRAYEASETIFTFSWKGTLISPSILLPFNVLYCATNFLYDSFVVIVM